MLFPFSVLLSFLSFLPTLSPNLAVNPLLLFLLPLLLELLLFLLLLFPLASFFSSFPPFIVFLLHLYVLGFFYRRATSKSSLKSGGCSHSHYFSLCLHVLLSPWPLSRSAPLFLFLLTASFHHRLGGLPGLEDHFALVLHFQRPLLSTTVSVSMHQSDNEARFGGEDRNVCVCVCSRWPEQRRCISFLYLVCDLKCGFSSLCSPQGRTAADLSGLAKSLCDALRACGTLI